MAKTFTPERPEEFIARVATFLGVQQEVVERLTFRTVVELGLAKAAAGVPRRELVLAMAEIEPGSKRVA